MALLPAGQWVRRTNLPSAADFQFADDADFFDLFGQITQIYPTTISYTQMRPIRSDLRRFFTLPPVPLIGVYVWVGVKGVYKNFCIYIVRKR